MLYFYSILVFKSLYTLSFGRTFSGTGIDTRHPFSALSTGFKSYLISLASNFRMPVVVPVMSIFSPFSISEAYSYFSNTEFGEVFHYFAHQNLLFCSLVTIVFGPFTQALSLIIAVPEATIEYS